MNKKSLIIYESYAGNTEKVAYSFKSTFEKHGWQSDIFKIGKNSDFNNLPFKFEDYDFVCAGSGIKMHLPYENVVNVIRKTFFGSGSSTSTRSGNETSQPAELPDTGENMSPEPAPGHRKIVLGAHSPKAVVFATYAGFEFGPREALPSLELLALEIEHLGFQCIGKFCCPGKFLKGPTPLTYHGDIRSRPDERDLLKAEMFIEEKLEEITDRTG